MVGSINTDSLNKMHVTSMNPLEYLRGGCTSAQQAHVLRAHTAHRLLFRHYRSHTATIIFSRLFNWLYLLKTPGITLTPPFVKLSLTQKNVSHVLS